MLLEVVEIVINGRDHLTNLFWRELISFPNDGMIVLKIWIASANHIPIVYANKYNFIQ